MATRLVKKKESSGHIELCWTRRRGDFNATATIFVKNKNSNGILNCAGLGGRSQRHRTTIFVKNKNSCWHIELCWPRSKRDLNANNICKARTVVGISNLAKLGGKEISTSEPTEVGISNCARLEEGRPRHQTTIFVENKNSS
jgi:hypothetical protein